MSNDPHRALLRVAGALRWYAAKVQGGTMDEQAAHQGFGQHFSDSVDTLRGYLETGANNPSMTIT